MTPSRRRALVVAGSLVAVLALLLAAEAALRLLGVGRAAQPNDAEFTERSLNYLEPCYRRSGASLVETNAGRPPPLRHHSIRRARTPGVPRIAVVGESSADMLGQSLSRLLEQAPCERRYEVLECAIPGSGLEHMERRFDEVMDLSPDAVVITFGHNLGFLFSTDAARLRARRLRDRSRLLTLLGAPFDGPRASPSAPFASRLPRFEAFLQRAAREGRRRRVGVVMTTMAGNLWIPPTSHTADLAAPALFDARYTEASVGPREAAALLDASDSALGSFERGVLLSRANDPAAARASLERALERDPFVSRATNAVNDAIRRVAAREGALLRDTVRAVEAGAPQGLPGWESFRDNCHLRASLIDREAGAVFELARPAMGLPPTCALAATSDGSEAGDLAAFFRQLRGFSPEMRAGWYEAGALQVERRSIDDEAGESREVAALLGGSPPPSPEALVAVAEGRWRAGHVDEARAINERARGAGSAEAWVQLGIFHLRQRAPDAAREAWQRALSMDPQRADALRFVERSAGH